MVRLVGGLALCGLTILCAGLLLTPFVYLLVRGKPVWWRRVTAVAGSCAVLAVVAGFAAYVLLPADYTARGRWTLHPVSNTLAEIHAVDLERMAHPGVFSPEAAVARWAEIARERRDFARAWSTVAGAGLGLLALALLARRAAPAIRRRWVRPPSLQTLPAIGRSSSTGRDPFTTPPARAMVRAEHAFSRSTRRAR